MGAANHNNRNNRPIPIEGQGPGTLSCILYPSHNNTTCTGALPDKACRTPGTGWPRYLLMGESTNESVELAWRKWQKDKDAFLAFCLSLTAKWLLILLQCQEGCAGSHAVFASPAPPPLSHPKERLTNQTTKPKTVSQYAEERYDFVSDFPEVIKRCNHPT